jgi:hypothetical protein
MIIVNAEAVEATAATLSAAEALEILAPSANAITNEEAASLRQIVAAVATRDPATAQRLAAKKPPPPPPPPQNGSAASELKTFLETADLGRYADALVAAGCASVARLKAMPQEELKNLKDPRTGGRVLAVGALARLRRQLNASPTPPPAPPPSGATPEPALTRHLAELGLDRFAPALARAGVSTVENLLDVDPKDLRNLVDPETGQKVLAVGPYSKLRASLEKLRESAPPPPPPQPVPVVTRRAAASSLSQPRASMAPPALLSPRRPRAARADASTARDARRNASHRRQEAPDAFAAFLAEAGLGRVEEPLKRCGIATLQQLRDTPAAALKAAVDPQTGSRVLAVGPLSKLRAALREQDSAAEVPAGVVFAASDGDACAECLDRRLFAFPASHASVVNAILAAPDRGASIRVFLWDASRKRLHGIFRPDAAEGDSAENPVVPSAFTSAPWTGVAPPPGKATAQTKFPCQLRVAPVRAFEPLPATLAGSVLQFERPGCQGAPAYDLTAEQVATVSRLFMTRGA